MINYVVYIAIETVLLLVFLIGVCYLAAGFFSFVPRNKFDNAYNVNNKNVNNIAEKTPNIDNAKLKTDVNKPVFAVVIPAHNEMAVIGRLIQSINDCYYPKQNINIFCVADGCTDYTAKIARSAGACVIERETRDNKGSALKAGFDYILENEYDFDGAVVFDADTTVDRYFFEEMSKRLIKGDDVIQGYIDSQNPKQTWVSHAHSVWYWISNRTFQTGFDRVGLGCRLEGTGFVIKKDILKSFPWKTETMAEDREYTCYLADNGIKIAYEENARIYDEKPTRFTDSINQRTRWSTGIWSVQSKYTIKFIKKFNIWALLNLWYESFAVFACNIILLSALLNVGIWQSLPGKSTVFAFFSANVLTAVLALVKDKKFDKMIIFNFVGFFIYILSWFFVGIKGLFPQKSWYHTNHG